MEEDQDLGRTSPPWKKTKTEANSSSSSTVNAAAVPPTSVQDKLTLRHKIDAHKGECNSIQFLNNSQFLISGGKDTAVKVWCTTNGTVTKSLEEGVHGSVCDLAISPDNSTLVAGLTSRNLCVWDLNSGQVLQILSGHKQKVCAVDISKITGQYIVSAAVNDSAIKIWDLHSEYPINSFCFSSSSCNDLCFVANDRIICTGHDDGNIIFHNVERLGKYCYGFVGKKIKGHTQSITSICSLQNGNVVMSSGRDNLHNLIDLRTMQVCTKFKTKCNRVATKWTRTCVSPDENLAVVGSSDGMVYLWSILMGKKIDALEGHDGSVLSCSWGGMGNSLVTADSNGVLCFWS